MSSTRFDGFDLVIDGRFSVPDPELVRIADAIIDEFLVQRQRYVPLRQVHVGKKTLLHFYRAAEKCRARSVSPAEYVSTVLKGMAALDKFWPTMIDSDTVLELADATVTADDSSLGKYRAQMFLFEKVRRIYGDRPVIEDLSMGFTPLFRFVCSKILGLTDLAARFAPYAREEFKQNPDARRVFEEFCDEF